MKRIFATILVVGVLFAVSIPVANAVETERVTWGQLKCMYNPRCK